MLRRVRIQDWQKVTEDDFNNFGRFPQQTFDEMLRDLGPGSSFAGFPVAQLGPSTVRLGPGRLYSSAGPFFFLADDPGAEIDFLGYLPVVTRRWATISVWGQDIDTQTEPRTFITDATSRATVARVVSTESRRHVNHAPVFGQEGPDPLRPAIAANVTAVAYVLLSPAGIVSITPAEEHRAESLFNLNLRANDMDSWRTRIGARLDTLGSDLANLASRLRGTARLNFVLDLARDMARVMERLEIPVDYTAWTADRFLTDHYSDIRHVDWLAKIEEGVRFPPAAEREAQIALLNQFDQTVIVQNNFMLPHYTEVPRLSVLGQDGEMSISQFEWHVTEWIEMTKTRMRIRYGTPFMWCSNTVFWFDQHGDGGTMNLTWDPIRNVFYRPATGETFQIMDGVQYTPDYFHYRLQQFWVDEVEEYYWDRIVTTHSLSGSTIAETFLNAQDGWLTSVDFFLTRAAADGDIHVLIVETAHGAPEFDRVVARTVVNALDLRAFPAHTRANFVPTFLTQGKRFAIVLQTAGNHFAATILGNKYAQGMLFIGTPAGWAMGDVERDIPFQLNFAEFDVPRVAVQLGPLELQNGIAAVDINVDSIRPPACNTSFEVQINGLWTPLGAASADSPNPLNGLPPLLPFRVVLTGTTDVMPGIGVGPNGWAYTWRPRPDFRHISTVQNLPAPVNVVFVDIRLEAWRGEPYHQCQVRLLTGDNHTNVVAPVFQDDSIDRRDAMAITRRLTFEFAEEEEIDSFRIRIEGTTDNVLATYHVAERVQVSLSMDPELIFDPDEPYTYEEPQQGRIAHG
jgi:hypothetical protein